MYNICLYRGLLLVYQTQDANYERPRSSHRYPNRRQEYTIAIMTLSDSYEFVFKP